jgi:hypothetical protein
MQFSMQTRVCNLIFNLFKREKNTSRFDMMLLGYPISHYNYHINTTRINEAISIRIIQLERVSVVKLKGLLFE